LRVNADDAVERGFENGAFARFAVTQFLLSSLAPADVADVALGLWRNCHYYLLRVDLQT